MRYFVSGHGWIDKKTFDEHYVPILDHILYGTEDRSESGDPNPVFYVGDFYGVDLMAQQYIVDAGIADCLIVCHMGDKPRNIAKSDHYKITTVGGFKSDEERDAYMTAHTDFDIAFYFRTKSGTEKNIKRRHNKIVS